MLSFDQAATRPLTTDALIQERATQLVGRAIRRQLWLFFLDESEVQLPLIVPIDYLPVSPPEELMNGLVDFADAAAATSVVAVIERYGDDALTPGDRAWALYLRASCAAASVRLRAVLLSHRRGVRWIADDDLL